MAINRTHDEKNNEQHIVTVSYIETGKLIIVYILLGMGLWCLTPLSTIFSYIVAVSFIGGGNRNKGNNKITELRAILQRESQNS